MHEHPSRPGFTLWFTGLPGAGKSTLAAGIGAALRSHGRSVDILDGDEVRRQQGNRLGFSKADRDANVRRVGMRAHELALAGGVAIAALVSPYRDVRDEIRRVHGGCFVEVFVECPLDDLIARDPKGLYARALTGEIPHFTGVSDPYEPPLSPELTIHTARQGVSESLATILEWLGRHHFA